MLTLIKKFNQLFDSSDTGKLILRVSFGGMMLLHGLHKIIHGASGIELLLIKQGLPSFLVWGVYVGEIIAPICLIIGFLTRPMAAVMAGTMVVALFLTNPSAIFTVNQVGGWGIEHQAVFFFAGLAIMFTGAGRFTLIKNADWR